LISRYEGAVIKNYEDLEGSIRSIQYLISPDEGKYKVYSNYQLAYKNANYHILFTCSNKRTIIRLFGVMIIMVVPIPQTDLEKIMARDIY